MNKQTTVFLVKCWRGNLTEGYWDLQSIVGVFDSLEAAQLAARRHRPHTELTFSHIIEGSPLIGMTSDTFYVANERSSQYYALFYDIFEHTVGTLEDLHDQVLVAPAWEKHIASEKVSELLSSTSNT